MPKFDEARRVAQIQDLVRQFRGLPVDLLPFDEVKDSLGLRHLVDRGFQEVPLDQIVGTLGRDREFNRFFFPRDETLRQRWERISRLARGSRGYDPVQLYKVGEAYFVVDGHHRISVARAMKSPTIEARVREFLTNVPMSPDDSVEEIILKKSFVDFVEATGLTEDEARRFEVSSADGYARLLEHIDVHRYYLGLDHGRCVSWEEALESWKQWVWGGMVDIIRRSGLVDHFPDSTPTDLYLYAMDYLHKLRETWGTTEGDAEDAVEDLVEQSAPEGWLDRLRDWWRGSAEDEA